MLLCKWHCSCREECVAISGFSQARHGAVLTGRAAAAGGGLRRTGAHGRCRGRPRAVPVLTRRCRTRSTACSPGRGPRSGQTSQTPPPSRRCPTRRSPSCRRCRSAGIRRCNPNTEIQSLRRAPEAAHSSIITAGVRGSALRRPPARRPRHDRRALQASVRPGRPRH